MSLTKEYPYIHKVEAILVGKGVYIALFQTYDESDDNESVRRNGGPTFLYEINYTFSRCPGFLSFVCEAIHGNFSQWDQETDYINVIGPHGSGEVGVEYGLLMEERNGHVVGRWTFEKNFVEVYDKGKGWEKWVLSY